MKEIIITKGLPASGKTCWANELLAKYPGRYKNICKDDLRKMLDNSRWSKANEQFILQRRDELILKALEAGYSVVVSDTNLHEKHEKRIRELAKIHYNNTGHSVNIQIKFFEITPEEAIQRDLVRPNSVGSGVIWDMYNRYIRKEEGKPEPIKQDDSLPHAIICDLDGTLALLNGRNPYDASTCGEDNVNYNIFGILVSYPKIVMPIFVTGREDKYKEETLAWLKNACGYSPDDSKYAPCKLLMRKSGDSRKDCIIKKEIFDQHIKDKYYIPLVLDDRNQVVKMWRELGLTCLQVAEGNF